MDYNQNKRSHINLRWKIFLYLLAFIAIILALLWVFGVLLMSDIYSSIISNRLESVANTLEERKDSSELDVTAAYISHENEMCIYIFKFNDRTATPLVSVHSNSACLIHNISSEELEKIYTSALQSEDGTFTKRVPLYGFNPADQAGNDNLSDAGLPDSIIYARTVTFKNGDDGVIFLNCAITPVTATVKTLQTMLFWISLISVVIALIVATFLSRHIAAPISDVTREARSLSNCSYDKSRVKKGYREINELSETLSAAAIELTKADRMKKDLLANVSHDLRTPLTLIEGYAEMMRDIPGENTPENMQIVIDESKRLSTLVSDLLTISKMQTDSGVLNYTRFDLTESLADTVDRVAKLNGPHGYDIRLETSGPVYVTADKTRILQVVYNLLGNAVTHTGEDKTVTVTETVSGNTVRVSVTDTGEGIAKTDLPLIWDRYYKVDKIHKRGMGGSGLGLSIVKEILILHDSRFGVSSTLGEGSTFWFELKIS